MNFKTLARDFQRLDSGAKLVFFGTVIAFIAAFLPWYQVERIENADIGIQRIQEVSNGFTKYPVFGFLSVIFAITAVTLFAQHLFGARKTFNISHGRAWLFLGGETLFVLLIALFVFSSEMSLIPSAELRFGLFLSVFAHFLILFGGYVQEKTYQKQESLTAFARPAPGAFGGFHIRPEEPDVSSEQLSLSDVDAGRKPVLR